MFPFQLLAHQFIYSDTFKLALALSSLYVTQDIMSSSTEKPRLDGGELKKNLQRRLDARCLSEIFDISNFDHNALLRGMQLTLVGGKYAVFLDAIRKRTK